MTQTREATTEERMTWGDCPVCGAKHGDPCRPEIGFLLGVRADGKAPSVGDGAHLGRLQKAPRMVRLVAA